MTIDWGLVCGFVATTFTVIAFIYGILRNFKTDINAHIDKLEKRMDTFETKINSIEERMFWMATGKKLEDAILEERLKRENV